MQKGGEGKGREVDLTSVSDIKLFQELAKRLAEKHSIDPLNLLISSQKAKDRVPISIFSTPLPPLEAIVKYLHENHNLSFTEIAKQLNRSVKTIWQSYQTAKRKKEIKLLAEGEQLPLTIFSNRSLSISENLLLYLSKTHKPKEIANLLNRSQRNINTILSRARRKDAKPQ